MRSDAVRSAPLPTACGGTEEEPVDCWHCRRNAVGVCRFCGRGVCEDHAETQPFVLELFRGKESTRALVVEDALRCGACTPRPDPVDLPELDEAVLGAGCDARTSSDRRRHIRSPFSVTPRGDERHPSRVTGATDRT